jgi:hypothetical protein
MHNRINALEKEEQKKSYKIENTSKKAVVII